VHISLQQQTNMNLYLSCRGLYSKGADSEPYQIDEDDQWFGLNIDGIMHDLNIWLDDLDDTWKWALHPVRKLPNGDYATVGTEIIRNGVCHEVEPPIFYPTKVYKEQ